MDILRTELLPVLERLSPTIGSALTDFYSRGDEKDAEPSTPPAEERLPEALRNSIMMVITYMSTFKCQLQGRGEKLLSELMGPWGAYCNSGCEDIVAKGRLIDSSIAFTAWILDDSLVRAEVVTKKEMDHACQFIKDCTKDGYKLDQEDLATMKELHSTKERTKVKGIDVFAAVLQIQELNGRLTARINEKGVR